ncbi:hypothetical protein BDV93DRAFT_559958 [Ceratobasidium sp. AG-I]|nr:hypothetical protein BDV93DRAFT_559958 [Ceratobasidium sp. AG-I]
MGLAEPPLPINALDAARLSIVNGHTWFRGKSGVVSEGLEALGSDHAGAISVEIPKVGEFPSSHPAWERVAALCFRQQVVSQREFGGLGGEYHPPKAVADIGAKSTLNASNGANKGAEPAINLKIQIIVNDTNLNTEISSDTNLAITFQTICGKVGPIPEGASLTYRLPGDAARSPVRILASSADIATAMDLLLGKTKRSRGAEKIMKVEITRGIESKLAEVPAELHSSFMTLYSKLVCHHPGHTKCFIDADAHPPHHKPVSIRDITFWSHQITRKRATLTTPPNDMCWDHERSVPHTSTASAGSSAMKPSSGGLTSLFGNSPANTISIASTSTPGTLPAPSSLLDLSDLPDL